MLRTTVRTLAVTGIALASFGTATATAKVSAVGASADNALEASISAYEAAFPQLSHAQARAAAAGADARRAVYDAAAADAAAFGGAWFDPYSGIVNLAATTDAAMSRAAALGKQYAVTVKPYRVKRSAAALEADAAKLRAGRDDLASAAKGNVGIDVKTNQVVAAVAKERKNELAGKAGNVKLVDDPGERGELDAGCTSRAACDYTIRSGAVMWRTNTSTPWCSVGFTARDSTNQRYVYTAGHCSTGNGEKWGTGALEIGPMWSSMNSGAIDAAIIKVTNSWFTTDIGGEIYMDSAPGRSVAVNAVANTLGFIVAGETVCLSANITQPNGGHICGVVKSNSEPTRRGMVLVDGADACRGDSGGGWYWLSPSTGKRWAYGLHSASDTGCHGDQGGKQSWFGAMPVLKSGFTPSLNVEVR